jgi:hypothetical protein
MLRGVGRIRSMCKGAHKVPWFVTTTDFNLKLETDAIVLVHISFLYDHVYARVEHNETKHPRWLFS